MAMRFVWEHNGDDTLLYSVDCVGAYARGESLDAAIVKIQGEINSYAAWKKQPVSENVTVEIIQEKSSDLQISDADSDVLFDTEKSPLTQEEYLQLKELVLQSAMDFYNLYLSIPDKNTSSLPKRNTFYGAVPRTAEEMYEHTKNVNAYYFGEIGMDADNEGTIFECRKRGFELLEKSEGFLDNPVVEGSYGELWSLRKVMRRFLWHDRIHAKAMYRMAVKTFGRDKVENTFKFILPSKQYDCGFTKENNWFRYRAGAIIVENDCVLLVGNEKENYLYSVGGGVHIGETAEDAVVREVFEETGVQYEVDRLAVVHENFFNENSGTLKGLNCHEISFYYMMKPRGTQELDSNSYTHGVREEMHWIPISDLGKYKAFPSFLKEYLSREHSGIEHIITDERKK